MTQSDPQLSEIPKKLDTLIRLFALDVVRDIKIQREQIVTLSDAGLVPKQIAEILGTTSNTVSVALVSIRKKRKGTQEPGTSNPEKSDESGQTQSR